MKLLLVDDDAGLRRIGQLALRESFEVLLAACGQEALEMAKVEKPDVIVLDVMMPGMDGTTVFAKLRLQEDTAKIPVIFMTAKVQQHEIAEYLELGAAAVIRKPFDPITLPAEIKAAYVRYKSKHDAA